MGKPADIFRYLLFHHQLTLSLGLIILEITANIILPENGIYWSQLREGNFACIDFGSASVPLVDLISSMLLPNPTQRPTARDILSHPLVDDLLKSL